MTDNTWWKMTFDEDNHGKKKTFNGRWPLIEDDVRSKITLDRNWPLLKVDIWWRISFDEDNLWNKTTFNGRWTLNEDYPWWKTTFGERQHLMMTFDGRQPLIEDDFWQNTAYTISPPWATARRVNLPRPTYLHQDEEERTGGLPGTKKTANTGKIILNYLKLLLRKRNMIHQMFLCFCLYSLSL